MTEAKCDQMCHTVKEEMHHVCASGRDELKKLEKSIQENPFQSILLAFAAGAAIISLFDRR
jgi:ElaB/YqjD/DUF883 family membrane-anchored ribosome-binding protein